MRFKTLQMNMPVELLLCYLLHTADYGILCCIYLLSTVLRLSSYNYTTAKPRKTMKKTLIFFSKCPEVRPIFCRTPDRFRTSENAGQSGIFRTGPESGSPLPAMVCLLCGSKKHAFFSSETRRPVDSLFHFYKEKEE